MFAANRWNSICKEDAAGNRITYGEAWFDQVKTLLHVSSYESTYFEIPQRLQVAEGWSKDPSESFSKEVSHLKKLFDPLKLL